MPGRNRHELKMDKEQHYEGLEKVKPTEAARRTFARKAYPTYSVEECLKKWGVNMKGGVAGGQEKTETVSAE